MAGWIAVGVGAMLGAWLRWGLAIVLNVLRGPLMLGTLVANLVGGFMIGLAISFFTSHPDVAPAWRLFAITGFLGGLTTFSSFSAESMALIQQGELAWAAIHTILHVAGALACCFAGYALYRALNI